MILKESKIKRKNVAMAWIDHPDYGIISIGQNTVQSPRDLLLLRL